MELVSFEDGRESLRFSKQKINPHKAGQEISPHAKHPLPGSADLCFISDTSMEQIIEHLNSCEISILEGPVKRTGQQGSYCQFIFRTRMAISLKFPFI